MLKRLFYTTGIVLLIATTGCIQMNLYEKQVPIPSQKWSNQYSPEFKFLIKDTSSRFRIFVVIRHTDLYQYNNLWVRIGLKEPGVDSVRHQNLNLQLADNQKWFGTGVDDIYEVRTLINPSAYFKSPGEYTFSISQIMRINPLPYILDVGIRIEKID